MVSKASELLPEPLKPVMTVNELRGISTSIFLRLCCRAPCTVMRSSIGWAYELQFTIEAHPGRVFRLLLTFGGGLFKQHNLTGVVSVVLYQPMQNMVERARALSEFVGRK